MEVVEHRVEQHQKISPNQNWQRNYDGIDGNRSNIGLIGMLYIRSIQVG